MGRGTKGRSWIPCAGVAALRLSVPLCLCASVPSLASCGFNGSDLNARKSPAELETIVAEHFKSGMTGFEVDNELMDMGVVFNWKPAPDGKVAVVQILPGGFFDAAPGWHERYTRAELRLYVADDRLTHAELIRMPAEKYGGGEQTTQVTLEEAPS